jgi:hypothetical protein
LKKGNSHAINKMSQINKKDSLIHSVPNDGPDFIQLSVPNDIPAITTSSFMQLNVPTNATSTTTGLRTHIDSHQISLNDVPIAHVSATTATTTATMTQVPTTRSATTNVPKYQLNKCKAT